MSLQTPIPGLVIRYSYLWFSEHIEGREEGSKDRPCTIVAAIRADEFGDTRVLVLPITHSPPDHASLAIEIPASIKRHLGLDDDRSWIVLSEWNDFVWPGPDLRRVPNADDASVAYGVLPPKYFSVVRERFIALINTRLARPIKRT